MRLTYKDAMGEDGAHIRLKLDTADPIALTDFVSEFVGIGNQFSRYIAREHPEMKAESEIYIQEVRSGCIEADLVAWIVTGGATVAWAIDKIDKAQILSKFVSDLRTRISPYFSKGGRTPDASKGELADFLKATRAIARDPNGSASLEAAGYEDGERKVRAAFKFTTQEARTADHEITEHRQELEKRTDQNQELHNAGND